MPKQVHLKITGKVQGVCFRAYTRDKALELGIKGWVKNCADGGVEAVAVGEEDDLKSFIAWCRFGPEGARVTQVKECSTNTKDELLGFEIRY